MILTQPEGKFDISSGEWMLTHDWSCSLSGGDEVHIKAGFLSDGASIPRLLWPLVGPKYAPRTFPAAFVHDALYVSEIVPRARADREFFTLLRRCGVGWLKARPYYLAVRSFGWMVWLGHSKQSIDEARVYVTLKRKESNEKSPVDLRPAD